ncbi:MAG: peroxiredoxin family protein, partial [Candidatus Saccharicenans sp.]|nr:peroxiredoxin family protein [Candidatus Saccharicenans sp.]
PRDTVKLWLESLPEQMAKVKNWKYPENLDQLDEKGKQSVERYRRIFPKDFTVSKDNFPLPFPILVDADHQVSSGLGLFTTSWGGGQVEQNIPGVYLIDEQGILRFKYISQNTVDRPEYEYLLKILVMIRQKKL